MRSIAVLLVMASHYTNNFSYWLGISPPPGLFYAGDLGVALFFGLSGFLIGGILLDIIAAGGGGHALLRFWIRRWMRTLPVYWVWLCVLIIFFPPARHRLDYFLHFATMTQNMLRPMPPHFWFAVSWSLPIEEWFYFLFGGVVVFAALYFDRRKGVLLALALFLLVPLVLRALDPQIPVWDSGHILMVPFRLDEIAYGVVIAVLYRARNRVFRHAGACLALGLLLLVGHWALQWRPMTLIPFRAYTVLRPTWTILGSVLCLPAAIQLQRLPAWLVWLARTISRQSYALYLVHLTLLVDVVQAYWWTHRTMTAPAIAAALVLPFIVAEILSRVVEQPVMRLRPAQFATPRPAAGPIEDVPVT